MIHNMIQTYNEYHLGDNLIHLNFLRRACKVNPDVEFVHYCHPQYHEQLKPLVEGVPIQIKGLTIHPKAVNAWIGSNNFFYQHPQCRHWANVHLDWFAYLSTILGIKNPMAGKKELLFDYPLLNAAIYPQFDYLVINARPYSNQLPDFSPYTFDKMVRNLLNNGHQVITTHPTGMCNSTLNWGFDVTQIGNLSNYCKHIISVDTGPLWPTFNVHNAYTVLSRTVFGKTFDSIGLTANTVCHQKL